MPAEEMHRWFHSTRTARINGARLRPMPHPRLRDTTLSIQKGQAEAHFLLAEDGSGWILKKFYPQRDLNRSYLAAVGRLLPRAEGFRSGTERRVVSSSDLKNECGCHYHPALARWLDGTILMPRVVGMDWATFADEIREGKIHLGVCERVAMCRGLSGLVESLEAAGCSHRDLSGGNVFIDPRMWLLHLIDYDSLYHPSLVMPQATTCGTVGYAPPFAWQGGSLDASATWCRWADRYPLALLNIEFLVLDAGLPMTAEGGIFQQDELRTRTGPGLSRIIARVGSECPAAAPLLEAALQSKGFDTCPSPQEWIRVCDQLSGRAARPPALSDVESISPDYFEKLLSRRRPAAPLWPAPSLDDLPCFDFSVRPPPPAAVVLPPDPWST